MAKNQIKIAPLPDAETIAASQFGPSFTFRLRKHIKGNFSGLWELSILDLNGMAKKVVSDADALNFCLENLQGELEAEGY